MSDPDADSPEYAEAARRRAVDRFDYTRYVQREAGTLDPPTDAHVAFHAERHGGLWAVTWRGPRVTLERVPNATARDHLLERGATGWLALDAPSGTPTARPRTEEPRCTGVFAGWCPRCGDCRCPPRYEGSDEASYEDEGCPLHASASDHGAVQEGGEAEEPPGFVLLSAAEFNALALSAVGYALGRKTYVVGEVTEIVGTHRPVLTPNARDLIVRDITRALDRNAAGMPADARAWAALRTLLLSPLPAPGSPGDPVEP